MSFPFFGEEFTFTQPDGSQITVRGYGDQHFAVFETLDGYTVTRNPLTGFFDYAALSPDAVEFRATGIPAGAADPAAAGLGRRLRISAAAARAKALSGYHLMGQSRRCEVRRERQRSFLRAMATAGGLMPGGPLTAPPRRTMTGDYTGLCLLIRFPDVPATIPREEVEAFCNTPGYRGYGNNGSVCDYFLDNSNGLLRYTNIVPAYYTAKNPRSYYTSPSVPFGSRARELILEALADLKAKGFDFTPLSADDENYVYAVNIFYAGPRVNNWGEGLWPHSWSLAQRLELAPGRYAYDYQITDMGSELSLATFCHENGHMICDYPDLYDYGYESNGAGGFCLMAYAGPDRKNPVQIGAYLKYKSGWASEVVPAADGLQAELPPTGNRFLIRSKSRTEYFLVENRKKAGRDAALPGEGLAIWHIDELGSNNDEAMSPGKHYECALEQADGRYDLERGANSGDPTDLFQPGAGKSFSETTEPSSRWWDGSSSLLSVFEISAAGDAVRFRTQLSGEGGEQTVLSRSSAPAAAIPDNDSTGVMDVISFAEPGLVEAIKVTLDISHSFRGDLLATLYAPDGPSVVLHNRQGGSGDDLKTSFDLTNLPDLGLLAGASLEGAWTLHVQDLARQDTGTLNRWQLEIQIRESAVTDGPVEAESEPGIRIPDQDPTGISDTIRLDAGGTLRDVAVAVDISHTYIQDLVVSLVSPAGTEVFLHRRSGGSADNIITTYDANNTPALFQLLGQPLTGDWRLKCSDHARRDRGKLNRWGLRIIR